MNLKETIGSYTIVVQKKGMDAADMDGEKVMMNLDKGKYYALNSVGSRIWELLEQPRPVMEVISVLLKEYEIDAETCEDSTLTFLKRLYNEELISII